MIGALWTGISGLSAHQKALDNESNNIANVNTVGYKAGRISFADQIYQGKIGKGSYVQDAEKIFVTGGSKITGVDYDVALQGDGFFTVVNKNTLGTAETFYTRAGNFRMGDSGTLQTADGFEVQGWAMSSIDTKNDVISTNQNASRFTSDYIKTLGSSIIRHNDYIETIAAKATNFEESAKSDSMSVFSGAGGKTKAAKLKDIDLALANYNELLQKYQNDPTLPSQGATSQISQINFRTGNPPTSIIGKEGDSIAVVLNGNTYTQNFVLTKTTAQYREDLWNSLSVDERALYGLMSPTDIENIDTSTEQGRADKDIQVAKYDQLAGKIETYKAMADQISNKEAGLLAYMAKDRLNPTSDVLNPSGLYEESTNLADMLRGVIQIKALVPGKEFKITQVAEYSGENTNYSVKGSFQTTSTAVVGSGKAAVDAARETLSRLVTGSQQSIYTTQDLYGGGSLERTYYFSIELYDKDTGMIIPVPNDGNVPPKATPIEISKPLGGDLSIDEIANMINSVTTGAGPQLGNYIVAKNINGNLVIEANDSNYDVEFDAKLEGKAIAPQVDLNDPLSSGNATNIWSYNGGGASEATLTLILPDTTPPDLITIEIVTEKDESAKSVAEKLKKELDDLNITNFEITSDGSNIVVTQTDNTTSGYIPSADLIPSLTPTQASVLEFIEVNPNYSGRKGAGGEFMEITTRVEQTSTQASLQLRLDHLNISDSKFGAFKIDDTGLITITDGGIEYAVGQVSIARFTNNRGLEAVGGNNFKATQESGNVIYSINNNNTDGVMGQALEISKADLSESLVNLMVFQRAFEANAKSITTSDELLSTLINLKR